jgi:hypothetical protein
MNIFKTNFEKILFFDLENDRLNHNRLKIKKIYEYSTGQPVGSRLCISQGREGRKQKGSIPTGKE